MLFIFVFHFSARWLYWIIICCNRSALCFRLTLMCLLFLRLPLLASAAHWSRLTSSLYCSAEVIDQPSTTGRLQTIFSSTLGWTHSALCLCVAPWSPAQLVWSLLGGSRPGPSLSHSWLMWILLSAGGTAACWGRSAAWHLWKRSWGNKGWDPEQRQTNTSATTVSQSSLSFLFCLFLQQHAALCTASWRLVKIIFASHLKPTLIWVWASMLAGSCRCAEIQKNNNRSALSDMPPKQCHQRAMKELSSVRSAWANHTALCG